jgi:hypothetical protein
MNGMTIPSTTLENHLLGTARQRAGELIEAFTAASFEGESTADISARAAAAFDRYCGGILTGLLSAVSPDDGVGIDWVRGHYLPLVIQFATTMRDSIADPICRHAAAQAIQCKILEHERHLRIVLDSRANSSVTTPTRSAEL